MYIYQIVQYLEEAVQKWPDRIAVIDGQNSLTFQDLRQKALSLASLISAKLNNKTDQIIAVFLPKSMEAIIADLAILYSGNAYMNLDCKNPLARLQAIHDRVKPALYLCREAEAPPIEYAFCLTFSWPDLTPLNPEDERDILRIHTEKCDTDLMCLINTSGSTGEPKAVALCHRSFIDFTSVTYESGLFRNGEVIGSLSPTIFDIFSFELCMLMAHGCAMALIPDHIAAFPVRLLEFLALEKVTFIFWVPTIMVNIANLDLLSAIRLPDLHMIWFAGEVFPTSKFNYWRRLLPQATFANFYGPIEITLDCLYHVIEREFADDEPIPLGRPFKNTKILLLNEDGTEAEKEGEICVAGSSLALGYYNNPEKTAEAFELNPLNKAYPEILYHTGDIGTYNDKGELIFLGRRDTLIKHKGYRIELGEIEHLANASGLIENCCAIYDGVNKKIILLYQGDTSIKELRAALAEKLPRYALPANYEKIAEMPRNANGKIDRYLLSQNYLKLK